MKAFQDKLTFSRLFGSICFILGLYLIYNEYHLFLVEKPTHSLIQKVPISSELFPLVQICAESGLDEKKIIAAGYETFYSFFSGFENEKEHDFLGWQGGSRRHPFDILEDLATVKASSDLLHAATFCGYDNVNIEAEIKAKRIAYPYGRCFSISPPAHMKTALSLEIAFNSSYLGNVKISFQDPQNYVKFLFSPFVLTGDTFQPNYDTIHNLEISLMKQMRDDSTNNCKEYDVADDYGNCYEEEMISMFKPLLNCTPPWFSDSREEVCQQNFSLSKNEQESVSNIFFDLFAGTFSPICPPPCSTMTVQPRFVRSEPAVNMSRVYINFPQAVQMTQPKVDVFGPGGLRAPPFSLRLLLLAYFGESPVCENLFPPIGITRRYMQKKYFG